VSCGVCLHTPRVPIVSNTFDQIEFRAIRRQPDHQKTVFEKAQGRLDRSTFMVGDILHHQKDTTDWIALHEQIFIELQERLTVLPILSVSVDTQFAS